MSDMQRGEDGTLAPSVYNPVKKEKHRKNKSRGRDREQENEGLRRPQLCLGATQDCVLITQRGADLALWALVTLR